MLPTSLAFGWLLWRRHHWGLLASLGYVSAAALVAAALTKGALSLTHDALNVTMSLIALMQIGPALYLVTILSFGLDADVAGRESCFPSGLRRLPVPTTALAGWPLAYGAAAATLYWLITALFVLRPWLSPSVVVPLWWPAALAAASMATFQAALWLPMGLPQFRIVFVLILLPGLITISQIAVQLSVPEPFLVSLFTLVAAAGWAAAYLGVRRARRDVPPNWNILSGVWRIVAKVWPRRRAPFTKPAGAQAWFEWNRHGLAVPLVTALVLPFVLVPLLLGNNDVIPAPHTLAGALAVPVLLAGLGGTTVGGRHPWVKDYYGISPFTATLPISTANLVAAKLKAAAWSILATWTLLAATVPLALALTGTLEGIADFWRQELGDSSALEVTVGLAAALIFLGVWSWNRLVGSLLLGLTGRKWIIQVSIYAVTLGFFMLVYLVSTIYKDSATREALLPLIPWLLGLWVLCRLLATGWGVRQLQRRKLVRARTIAGWVFALLLLGLLLFAALAWVVPRELVPLHYLALAIVLVLPMTRLSATPLALAWNRHR